MYITVKEKKKKRFAHRLLGMYQCIYTYMNYQEKRKRRERETQGELSLYISIHKYRSTCHHTEINCRNCKSSRSTNVYFFI